MAAIGYPDGDPAGAHGRTLRVDGMEIEAEEHDGGIVLSYALGGEESHLPTLAEYAAGRMLKESATLAWDDEQMTGTLTLGAPLRFADIDHLDVGKWEPKQILVVHAKDGRHVTLDAWHHAGARELAEKLLAHEPPFAVSPV